MVHTTPVKDFQLGAHLNDYKRDRQLTKAEVNLVLKAGSVWFVIADVGHELRLVEPAQCFKFWQQEVSQHLADGPGRLEDFPDEYLYFASFWVAEGARPIILLEKYH
jgi:hypothetical protein